MNETKAKNITIQDFELLIRTDDVDSGKALMQKLYNVRLTPSVSTPASQSLEIASTIPTIQSTEATVEISMTSSAFPDNKSVSKNDVVQFNPSHYHFVVEKPIKDGLIGQLGIINLQNKPINSMVIEPLAIARLVFYNFGCIIYTITIFLLQLVPHRSQGILCLIIS